MLTPKQPFSLHATKRKRAFNYPAAVLETEQDLLVACWEHLTPSPQKTILRLREEFFGLDKSALFSFCAEGLLRHLPKKERDGAKRDLQKFQFHHILPLSLGGTNDQENIALAPPKFHEDVHIVIKDADLPKGSEPVWLPIPRHPSGKRVWGYFPTLILIPPPLG